MGFAQLACAQDTAYANDDILSGIEDKEVELPVLGNDYGLVKGVRSLVVVEPPANGQAVVQEDNTILYTPNVSFAGIDEFRYEVCNADGSCDKALVEITIQDIDYIPQAINDTIIYLHGSVIQVDFLNNDIINGDVPVSPSVIQDLYNGRYTLTGDNKLEIEFDRDFIGKDSLKYAFCDIDDDCSEAYVFFDVRHGGDIDFYIPRGFSPNGDGINDTFIVPDLTTYHGISLSVIDSWGSVVYQSDNYSNDWNGIANQGSYNGTLVPVGTYYYYFKVEGVNKRITGYVYIAY